MDRDPPVAQSLRVHRLEHARTHVDVVFGAALAGVDDGGLVDGAGAGVGDADRGAAEGVVVGVGAVLHDLGGEGYDGVGVPAGVAAGTETWGGLVREEEEGGGWG